VTEWRIREISTKSLNILNQNLYIETKSTPFFLVFMFCLIKTRSAIFQGCQIVCKRYLLNNQTGWSFFLVVCRPNLLFFLALRLQFFYKTVVFISGLACIRKIDPGL
jgi:hypothetical protein